MISKISAFFMRRKNWTIPYALFLAVFVVMPLLLIVLYAFTDADGAFTFANFRKFMVHPEAMNTFVYFDRDCYYHHTCLSHPWLSGSLYPEPGAF